MAKKKVTKAARKEQEALVMGVLRRCLGPYLIETQAQNERFAAWKEIEEKGSEKDALAMIDGLVEIANDYALPGFVVAARPAKEGDWAGLRRAAYPLIRLRGATVGQGCGWNLSEEIIEHPFDGEEHVTVCPNCGINISWKAPVF